MNGDEMEAFGTEQSWPGTGLERMKTTTRIVVRIVSVPNDIWAKQLLNKGSGSQIIEWK
jgi:hypothetical protein